MGRRQRCATALRGARGRAATAGRGIIGALTVAALIALVSVAVTPAASADTTSTATVGAITYTSHFWSSQITSSAGMDSAWQSAPTNFPGYCNAGTSLLSVDGLSNAPCGSNTDIISQVVVPFTTSAAGSWHFQIAPDYGLGSQLLVDGTVVQTHWSNIYAGGNYGDPSQFFDYTADLAAGAHMIKIEGAEDCCDGAWSARYQLAGASAWTALQTSPPQVSVTGLSGPTLEYGSPDPGCLAEDQFDGTKTPAPALSPISGPRASSGLGSRTVTCTYTDSRGLTGSASATYTIVDTTAPVLSGIPPDLTIGATSRSGAPVSWSAPTAKDAVDGARPVSCVPASGSTFPLGTTTVTCSATDESGNTSTARFTVTVVDTTPPVLTFPPNPMVHTSSATGVPVSFDVTAADLVDGSDPVSCTPRSGAIFAVGKTTVSCTSVDAAGNKATGTLTVTVVLIPVHTPKAVHVALANTGTATWRYLLLALLLLFAGGVLTVAGHRRTARP